MELFETVVELTQVGHSEAMSGLAVVAKYVRASNNSRYGIFTRFLPEAFAD